MLHSTVLPNTSVTFLSVTITTVRRFCIKATVVKKKNNNKLSSLVHDSLKLIEWDKLCNSVASFAATQPGIHATKAQLWVLDQTYEESKRLLDETNAAVEIHKYGGGILDFSAIDIGLVNSGLDNARRGLPVEGCEAMAIVDLLQLAENMQFNLKAAIKEDEDWYQRFMPLSEKVMELVTNRPLVKFVKQLLDDDGSVKDSASSALKRSREQVRLLERKLFQLMDRLARDKLNQASTLEVSNDGRLCIRLQGDSPASFEGLLLSSHSGGGSIVEPLSAVPLNDELQQAKASVAKAESDVLLKITEKMQVDLINIENLFDSIVQLDVINARATYSLSFGGSFPDLFLPEPKDQSLGTNSLEAKGSSIASYLTERKWKLYIPRAHHPLLLQQHRQNLQMAIKEVNNATAEIRRRRQGGSWSKNEETEIDLSSLEMRVTQLKQAHPIPVDFFIAQKTKVLVVTGPNTGGKTICLKTVGLAVMMAKSGLYVLSSESVKIPWFDYVFADIGDEQSLSQSLSTFSGHLRQINEILKYSTSQSLVLLDEVGAGTNPLEGAALGMSLLESLAESGPLLTIATTHHGELKTLKYSNEAFENACMEFDDVNLKPTYKILWGVPGRSNAINIAERLGLPNVILDNARELYGAAGAEINEVILDMETLKQSIHEHVSGTQDHLKLSRDLHTKLLTTRRKLKNYEDDQRYKKMLQITEMASIARSTMHKKVRHFRSSAARTSQSTVAATNSQPNSVSTNEPAKTNINEISAANKGLYGSQKARETPRDKKVKLPKAGDIVRVSSLNKEATVLKVDPSRGEILVQAGFLKMKLSVADIST